MEACLAYTSEQMNKGGDVHNWALDIICRYFREGYLRAMAELIEKELQKFDSPEKTEIFFSAHGVPVSYVEQVQMHLHLLLLLLT